MLSKHGNFFFNILTAPNFLELQQLKYCKDPERIQIHIIDNL